MEFIWGSGLIITGAFFLWQSVGGRGGFWTGFACGLPAGALVLWAAVRGDAEIAVGVLWGAVAVNWAVTGVLGLVLRERMPRESGLSTLLWLAFGWGACWVTGHGVGLGRFGGWALVVVGLVAVIACGRQNRTDHGHERVVWTWRQGVVAVIAAGLVLVGTWLLVVSHGAMGALLTLPDSIYGSVVLAPLTGVTVLVGFRRQGQWRIVECLHGMARGSVALATLGLGAITVLGGGLHLTASALGVTLPWVAVLSVVAVTAGWVPQKTARWWSGLVLVLYLGYIISLLG